MTRYTLLPLVAIFLLTIHATSCKKDKVTPKPTPTQCKIESALEWVRVEDKGRSPELEWTLPCPDNIESQYIIRTILDNNGNVNVSEYMHINLPNSLVMWEDTCRYPGRKVKYQLNVRYPDTTLISTVVFEANNFYSFNAGDDQLVKAPAVNKVILVNRQSGMLVFYNYKTREVDSLSLGTPISGKCAIQEYNGTTELYTYSMQQQRILVVNVEQGTLIDNIPVPQQHAPKYVLAKNGKIYVVNAGVNDNLSMVRRDNKQVITTAGQGSFDLFGDEGAVINGDTSSNFLFMSLDFFQIVLAKVNAQGNIYATEPYPTIWPPITDGRPDMFYQIIGTPYFLYGTSGLAYDHQFVTQPFNVGGGNLDYTADIYGNIYAGGYSWIKVINSGGMSYSYSHTLYTSSVLDRLVTSEGKLYVFSKAGTGSTKKFTVEEISL